MRYIVLAIEDNEVAEQLVTDVANNFYGDIRRLPEEASIVGMFAVPTKFCDDEPVGHRGKKTQAGWTRGKKYGWWVCGSCKKPTKAWGTNLNSLLSSCVNLLVPNQILGAAKALEPQS
jgi:hypothetical protein